MPSHSFTVNGEPVTVEAPPDLPLLWVLRDLLGITGPKYGCGVGVCKACTCHLDGVAFTPCVTPVAEVDGKDITTVEGLADGTRLHPVQQAWVDIDVPQCGYCQAGWIMTTVDLLNRTNQQPTDADIDALDNICRCGTYVRIRQAIKHAAEKLNGQLD